MFKVIWDSSALKDLKCLDKAVAKRIVLKVESYLSKNPKSLGKPLSAEFSGLYRYRFNDYRIIYEIREKEVVIVVVKA